MMNLSDIKKNEVIQLDGDVKLLSFETILDLKLKAQSNPRRRARINVHYGMENKIHEMIIVHMLGNYIRPHRHKNKSESFHLIEGDLQIVIFSENGEVDRVVPMGTYDNKKKFYYRIEPGTWHTLVVKSEFVVFHESTNGPFILGESEQAPWAPDDTSNDLQVQQECQRYLQELMSLN
jgi:cupin fold WbuC family metalloprotein